MEGAGLAVAQRTWPGHASQALRITGSQWQASTSEVRNWALGAGFELGARGINARPGHHRVQADTSRPSLLN